jgi:hypothetical protein
MFFYVFYIAVQMKNIKIYYFVVHTLHSNLLVKTDAIPYNVFSEGNYENKVYIC